jgi:hypothetical protein
MSIHANLESLIVGLLSVRGPMTSAEIAGELGRSYDSVRACIATARANEKELFYIAGFGEVAGRGYKRPAMYAAGNKSDMRYPHLGMAQKYKRHWQRTKTKKRIQEIGPDNHFAALIAQVTP